MAEFPIEVQVEEEGSEVIDDLRTEFRQLNQSIQDGFKGVEESAERTSARVKSSFRSIGSGGFAGIFAGLAGSARTFLPLLGFATSAVRGVVGIFSGLPRLLSGVLSTGFSVAGNVFGGLVTAATTTARTVVSAFGGIAGGVLGALGAIPRALGSIFSRTGAIISAALGVGAVGLVNLGARFQDLESRGTSLARSIGQNFGDITGSIRAGALGTISSLDTLTLANNALLLQVAETPKQFELLASGAKTLAQTVGISTKAAFESLVIGIGRQSRLLLDNVGIIVRAEEAYERFAESVGKAASELTDADRRTAFRQEVFRQLEANVNAAGGAFESLSVILQRSRAQFSDLLTNIGQALGPAAEVVGRALGTGLERLNRLVTERGPAIGRALAERIEEGFERFQGFLPTLQEGLSRVVDFATSVGARFRDVAIPAIQDTVQFARDLITVLSDPSSDTRQILAAGFDAAREAASRAFDVISSAVGAAVTEMRVLADLVAQVFGSGGTFSAEDSVIARTFDLILAKAREFALTLQQSIGVAFSSVILGIADALATLGTQLADFAALAGAPVQFVSRLIDRVTTFREAVVSTSPVLRLLTSQVGELGQGIQDFQLGGVNLFRAQGLAVEALADPRGALDTRGVAEAIEDAIQGIGDLGQSAREAIRESNLGVIAQLEQQRQTDIALFQQLQGRTQAEAEALAQFEFDRGIAGFASSLQAAQADTERAFGELRQTFERNQQRGREAVGQAFQETADFVIRTRDTIVEEIEGQAFTSRLRAADASGFQSRLGESLGRTVEEAVRRAEDAAAQTGPSLEFGEVFSRSLVDAIQAVVARAGAPDLGVLEQRLRGLTESPQRRDVARDLESATRLAELGQELERALVGAREGTQQDDLEAIAEAIQAIIRALEERGESTGGIPGVLERVQELRAEPVVDDDLLERIRRVQEERDEREARRKEAEAELLRRIPEAIDGTSRAAAAAGEETAAVVGEAADATANLETTAVRAFNQITENERVIVTRLGTLESRVAQNLTELRQVAEQLRGQASFSSSTGFG